MTSVRYAEVIGDPISHSKSPIIHNYWLHQLGIEGDYRRTRLAAADLANFLDRRRSDQEWRGCNVTIPHKQSIIPLLDRLEAGAETIGAVNCVVPEKGALVGYNSDIDGVAAALDSTPLLNRKAALIGAGGGARAVVAYLARRGVGRIAILARDSQRAETLRALAPHASVEILGFDRSEVAFGGAAAIINASPLGMSGAASMPPILLDTVAGHAAGTTAFDLVTTPTHTQFLTAASEAGGKVVDGLAMLVGQAARAFELFFGEPPPPPNDELRDLLITDRWDSA